jgi:hypothetical protein
MKKYFLLAIIGVVLAFFQTSSAGELSYGRALINALLPNLKTTSRDCLSVKSSKDVNGWCGQSVLSVRDFQIAYDNYSITEASKIGYRLTTFKNWENVKDLPGGMIKNDVLDDILFTIGVFPSGGITQVLFLISAPDDKIDIAPSASITSVSGIPIPTQPTPATSPTSSTPLGQSEVTVLRYLCEQPENGYARVFGTLKNSSNRTINYAKFNVDFFDGSKFVGQKNTYIQADTLAPNAESSFEGLAKTPAFTRCELSFEDSSGKLTTKLP